MNTEDAYMVVAIVLTGFIVVLIIAMAGYVLIQDLRLILKDKKEENERTRRS